MQGHHLTALFIAATLVAGCRSDRPLATPYALNNQDSIPDGAVVGDDRTAMEAATASAMSPSSAGAATGAPQGTLSLAAHAPESYVVKRGDTLWAISKVFLRDPWFWPEIWQVNPQVQNPHLIYPGDTLRLVYIDGRPRVTVQRGSLERGDEARATPRVRSQPLAAAVTTIPYETIAAFMSKPSVLSKEQIKAAPYVLATRDNHVVMADGNTVYARGFAGPVELGTHYNVVRVGDPLRDPEDNRLLGYNGIYTGSGHVTRDGNPVTLVLTDSSRETVPGDKLFAGAVDVPLDFIPSSPKIRIDGQIMAVSDGASIIGQYQVVVINRGARDGLAPGNVLAVFDAGAVVRDTENDGFLSGMSRVFTKRVTLPDERTGTFMVFKTFDRMSYGLIMEAKDIIHIADRVANP